MATKEQIAQWEAWLEAQMKVTAVLKEMAETEASCSRVLRIEVEHDAESHDDPEVRIYWAQRPPQVAFRFAGFGARDRAITALATYFNESWEYVDEALGNGNLWVVPLADTFEFAARLASVEPDVEQFTEWDEADVAAGSLGRLDTLTWHEVTLGEGVAA